MSAHKHVNAQRSGWTNKAVHSHCPTACVCVCVCTSTGSPTHQLQPWRTGAAEGTDCVGALTSQTQTVVLTFIHICTGTHTTVFRHHQWVACSAAVKLSVNSASVSTGIRNAVFLAWQVTLRWSRRYEINLGEYTNAGHSSSSNTPIVMHLRTSGRRVLPWSLGHSLCRRRSLLCWCRHLRGMHLQSGTHQCLGNSRRQRG